MLKVELLATYLYMNLLKTIRNCSTVYAGFILRLKQNDMEETLAWPFTFSSSLALPDHIMRQALIDVPIISAVYNTTDGTYNRNIDNRLARNVIWPGYARLIFELAT